MKTKLFVLAILALLSLIGMMYPVVYWFINSELTKMELFKEFWWLYLVCGGVFVFSGETLKSMAKNLKDKK